MIDFDAREVTGHRPTPQRVHAVCRSGALLAPTVFARIAEGGGAPLSRVGATRLAAMSCGAIWNVVSEVVAVERGTWVGLAASEHRRF